VLQKIVGRRLDVLTTADGRTIPGEFFPHFLKDFRAILRFQVVQASPDEITLRLVLGDGWTQADEDWLRVGVREVLGSRCGLTLEKVDDIPLTGAGKHRVVVNLCRPPGQGPTSVS
jgi:phenylacetate-CoA ligase